MIKDMNRREFIKKSSKALSAMAVVPFILPGTALGKDGSVAPSNRLQGAQLGCGGMGTGNMRGFLNFKEVQIVAVCDVDRKHAEQAKKYVDDKYGNNDCRIYNDYREMIEKENLDIISQALPDHWHAKSAVDCARKGIDMYGEKPLSRTIGEGRAICDAVEQYGIIWQTGSWQRSVSSFRSACELVRNGRLGKISHVEVGLPNGSPGPAKKLLPVPAGFDWDMWLGPAPWRPYQDFGDGSPHYWWRHFLDYSGGKLTDWVGHHADIAHWGLGFDRTGPVEVEGKGTYPTEGIYNVPYEYDFTCTYADDTKIRVANKGLLPKGQGVCFYGENGWLFISRSKMEASDPKLLKEKIGSNEIRLYKSQDHKRNFIDCVKSRKETVTPAEIAHRSISVGLLGEVAMLTGRKLKWNPAIERFIGDDAANSYLMRSYRSGWHL